MAMSPPVIDGNERELARASKIPNPTLKFFCSGSTLLIIGNPRWQSIKDLIDPHSGIHGHLRVAGGTIYITDCEARGGTRLNKKGVEALFKQCNRAYVFRKINWP